MSVPGTVIPPPPLPSMLAYPANNDVADIAETHDLLEPGKQAVRHPLKYGGKRVN